MCEYALVAVTRDIYPKAPLREIAWVRLTLFRGNVVVNIEH